MMLFSSYLVWPLELFTGTAGVPPAVRGPEQTSEVENFATPLHLAVQRASRPRSQ